MKNKFYESKNLPALRRGHIAIEWSDENEGFEGQFNPRDASDKKFLRIYVYDHRERERVLFTGGTSRTFVPVATDPKTLKKLLVLFMDTLERDSDVGYCVQTTLSDADPYWVIPLYQYSWQVSNGEGKLSLHGSIIARNTKECVTILQGILDDIHTHNQKVDTSLEWGEDLVSERERAIGPVYASLYTNGIVATSRMIVEVDELPALKRAS